MDNVAAGDGAAVAEMSWGVRPALVGLLSGAGLLAVVWCLLAGAAEDRLVAGAAAIVLLGSAAAAFRLRRRLVAGPDGFVIRRVFGARGYGWDDVAALTVPTRRRRGLATTTLEFDLVDDQLIVLGRFDLGADPAAVARALRAVQQGRK